MREKYARGSKLGSGGFGEVYKSTLVATGQIFAQKILASAADPEDVERFKREVRLLKTLNHPRIIRVVDTQLRVPPYWYVMPLYAGNLSSNLSDVRAEERMRSKIVNQLLQAIGYAHDKGVIHRDLKPENVLLDTDGDIAVSDFGLGRRIDSHRLAIPIPAMASGRRITWHPNNRVMRNTLTVEPIFMRFGASFTSFTLEIRRAPPGPDEAPGGITAGRRQMH